MKAIIILLITAAAISAQATTINFSGTVGSTVIEAPPGFYDHPFAAGDPITGTFEIDRASAVRNQNSVTFLLLPGSQISIGAFNSLDASLGLFTVSHDAKGNFTYSFDSGPVPDPFNNTDGDASFTVSPTMNTFFAEGATLTDFLARETAFGTINTTRPRIDFNIPDTGSAIALLALALTPLFILKRAQA